MNRRDKPTRRMNRDAHVSGNTGWATLHSCNAIVEEMLSTAEMLGKLSLEVDCIPPMFLGQVAEVFRGRGHEVWQGNNGLVIKVKREE